MAQLLGGKSPGKKEKAEEGGLVRATAYLGKMLRNNRAFRACCGVRSTAF